MSYNPNIPQANDKWGISQQNILDNFIALGAILDVDNGVYTFPENALDPTTAADTIDMYAKEGVYSSEAELFIRRESSGDVIGFTEANLTSTGWSRLPSGLLLKWGTATANGTTNVLFPTGAGIPAFSTIVNVLVTTVYDSGDTDAIARLVQSSLAVTDFDVFGSAGLTSTPAAADFYYLALGT